MKTTNVKQTQTEDDPMMSYLVNSTPDTSFSQTPVFDPSSTQHKTRLYHWCKTQWSVFCKSLHHQNSIYYHECCNSFSRRRFSKVAGHPPLQTSSIVTIPSFKEVNSSDDFFRWLLKMLTFNSKKGHQCYFPTINRYHVEADDKVKQEEQQEEEPDLYLKKRVDDLNRELCDSRHRLVKAQDDNKVLVKAAMNWYQRYQDVLEVDRVPTEFQTPQKVVNNYFSFEDN